MSAYRCESCELNWPKIRECDFCPDCGERTKYSVAHDPEFDEDEAVEVANLLSNHVKFERWLTANQWPEIKDDGLQVEFHGRPHTPYDGRVFAQLVTEMDRLTKAGDPRGSFLGETHIFLT